MRVLYESIKISDQDVNDSSIWFLPGALSTSRYFMSTTLRNINSFFLDNDSGYLNGRTSIFCPYSSGKKRFIEAMEYNNNPQEYFSEKIHKFVRKYLISRLIKKKKLSFITYSVGGKELAMVKNAARSILVN